VGVWGIVFLRFSMFLSCIHYFFAVSTKCPCICYHFCAREVDAFEVLYTPTDEANGQTTVPCGAIFIIFKRNYNTWI
jgi:hypothetical protein